MALFRTTPLYLSLYLLLTGGLASAQDMHRCLRADGSTIYTDRLCEPEQTEKSVASSTNALTPRPISSGRTGLPPPPACSKSPDDLLYSIRSAIDMKDVNQLVKSYHWAGVSQEKSEGLLIRLDAIADRPLLDVQLLYPQAQRDALSETPADEPSGNDVPVYRESAHKPPYAMKIMQYRSATATETVSTVFHLQRHYQCWWIRF